MRRMIIVAIALATSVSPANASVTLGEWNSTDGFPTASEPSGYSFLTVFDEGGDGALVLPPPSTTGFAFIFPIRNDHPTAAISLDEISLTTGDNGSGSIYTLSIGIVDNGSFVSEYELNDGIPAGSALTSPFDFGPIDTIQPGEVWVAYVVEDSTGGPGGVLNLTVTGTAVPEPSGILLLTVAGFAFAGRRRR